MGEFSDIMLGIGIPSTERTYMAEFVDSFYCVSRPVNIAYIKPGGKGPIDVIRNELVRAAQHLDCTHLWMADTDQIYPRDTLLRLLRHRLDVVSAKVHRRYPPYDPLLLRGVMHDFKPIPEDEWKGGGLVEIDATGCGSIIYNMRVFDKIEEPWFEFLAHETDPVGEDIHFCCKLKEAGFKIFVDCGIEIGHLNMGVITEESYWAYRYTQRPEGRLAKVGAAPRRKPDNIEVMWEVEEREKNGNEQKEVGSKDGKAS